MSIILDPYQVTPTDAQQQYINDFLSKHGIDENSTDEEFDAVVQLAISTHASMAGFEYEPPTIEEFIDDDFYCPYIGDGLFPFWRQQLKECFPSKYWSPYLEVACTGPIGIGKTTFILAAMLYDLCRLLCMTDPHYSFQIMAKAPIVIAFINTTLKLADDVLYNQFKEWIVESKFFQKHLIFLAKNRWKLRHNIVIARGSRMGHMLGRNVIMATLSELNFQGESQKKQAYKNYTAVKRRMETRFGRGGGYISPGRLWLDSSRTDEAGFLEQHLKNLYDHPENSKVIAEAVWVILGDAGKNKYSGETFPVYKGDESNAPKFMEGEENKTDLERLRRDNPNDVIDVPIEHRAAFEIDLFGALRDIAGVATWSAGKFFPYAWQIDACLIKPRGILPEVIALDFFDDADRLIDKIKDRNGNVIGLMKGYQYYVHYDLGVVKDNAGIGFTRNAGMVTIKKPGEAGYGELLKDECKYCTDLHIKIAPKPGSEIPITKLKNLVIDLGKLGYLIAGVSADGFQSTNLLQDFKALNVPVELISTQKRDSYDCYGFLKRCIQDKRWETLTSSTVPGSLRFELLNLIDTGKMIDHPTDGDDENNSIGVKTIFWSKDSADGCAGSVWHCQLKTAGMTRSDEAYDDWLKSNLKAKQQVSLEEKLFDLAQQQKNSNPYGSW